MYTIYIYEISRVFKSYRCMNNFCTELWLMWIIFVQAHPYLGGQWRGTASGCWPSSGVPQSAQRAPPTLPLWQNCLHDGRWHTCRFNFTYQPMKNFSLFLFKIHHCMDFFSCMFMNDFHYYHHTSCHLSTISSVISFSIWWHIVNKMF